MAENALTEQSGRMQIRVWLFRAIKAETNDDSELMEDALDQCWNVQKTICKLTGADVPERPVSPSDVIDWLGKPSSHPGRGPEKPRGPGRPPRPDRPQDPDQPVGVPRKPSPNAGAGAVALPLPEKKQDDE